MGEHLGRIWTVPQLDHLIAAPGRQGELARAVLDALASGEELTTEELGDALGIRRGAVSNALGGLTKIMRGAPWLFPIADGRWPLACGFTPGVDDQWRFWMTAAQRRSWSRARS